MTEKLQALYIEAVFYDSNQDEIFIELLFIQNVTITYFDNMDLNKIEYKGETINSNPGIYLLGCL